MLRRVSLLILLGVLLVSVPGVYAQGVPVYDNANWLTNLAQVAQLILDVVESVTQTAQGVENLLPLDDIAIASDYADTMSTLGELVAEGQGLMGDAQQAQAQIQALFGHDVVHRTPRALSQGMGEMQGAIHEAQMYAIRVQTLIGSLTSAVNHLITIAQLIGGLGGNLRAQQASTQLLAVGNQTQAMQAVQAAAYQRVQILKEMERQVIVRSYNYIQCMRWSDWPGFQGCAGGPR